MKDKRAVGNTTKQVQDDPMGFLASAMVMGGSEAIPHQEASGQRSFVGSDTLPTDIGRHSDYDAKAILEAAGVKFLGPVEGDEMFQYVEFPQGWKKVATDHSMWSDLLDDKGRERASIFYKAAFYDRSAHMSLSCRFGVSFDYDRFDKENVGVANVTDGGKVVHTTEPIPANGEKRYDTSDKANKVAVEWLDTNHPDWRNPGAYWD
jgi:hypothetical protein